MAELINFAKTLRGYKSKSQPKLQEKVQRNPELTNLQKIVDELTEALIDKKNFEVQNEKLKIANREHQTKIKALTDEIVYLKKLHEEGITAIEKQVNTIQSQIQPNEAIKLKNLEGKAIQRQCDQKFHCMKTALMEETTKLNEVITNMVDNESVLKSEVLRLREKYQGYKNKLKFSISVIANLNKYITGKLKNRRDMASQTDKHVNARDEDDKNILSEIFFKDRPFHDDDIDQFLLLNEKQIKNKGRPFYL